MPCLELAAYKLSHPACSVHPGCSACPGLRPVLVQQLSAWSSQRWPQGTSQGRQLMHPASLIMNGQTLPAPLPGRLIDLVGASATVRRARSWIPGPLGETQEAPRSSCSPRPPEPLPRRAVTAALRSPPGHHLQLQEWHQREPSLLRSTEGSCARHPSLIVRSNSQPSPAQHFWRLLG